jgi:hypothetical protein
LLNYTSTQLKLSIKKKKKRSRNQKKQDDDPSNNTKQSLLSSSLSNFVYQIRFDCKLSTSTIPIPLLDWIGLVCFGFPSEKAGSKFKQQAAELKQQ